MQIHYLTFWAFNRFQAMSKTDLCISCALCSAFYSEMYVAQDKEIKTQAWINIMVWKYIMVKTTEEKTAVKKKVINDFTDHLLNLSSFPISFSRGQVPLKAALRHLNY